MTTRYINWLFFQAFHDRNPPNFTTFFKNHFFWLHAEGNRRFSGSFSGRSGPRTGPAFVADGPKCEKIVVQSELNTQKHQFTEFRIGRVNISKCIFQSARKNGGKKRSLFDVRKPKYPNGAF